MESRSQSLTLSDPRGEPGPSDELLDDGPYYGPRRRLRPGWQSEESDSTTESLTPSLLARRRCRRHGREKGQRIRVLYGVALITWLILIWVLCLWRTDTIGWVILLVPPLVFFFGYLNADNLTIEIEDNMFEANYLSVGLIIVLPLLMWISGHSANTADRRRFVQIVIIALILSMLSMIDLWVTRENVSLVKHGKSILQTMSIALLIFALYWYVQKESCVVGPAGTTITTGVTGPVVATGMGTPNASH